MSALPLIPELPSGKELVGIARLAAAGEAISEGHNVEYLTIAARSLLNKCTAPRMPFAWTINPYRGCEFACKYCYARYTHEFMEMEPEAFERKIYVKQQAAWLLRRDLKRVKPGEDIAIGTATDPYQPAERRFEVTRAVMEELAQHAGLSIGVVTKSQLVLRDVELFRRISERNSLTIHLTVTTTDEKLARILEPRAPRPDLRLDAVGKLVAAGVDAAVLIAPVLPGITDSPKALESVVRAVAAAGARYLYANPLFLKPCSEKIFTPFLEQHFPALVEAYKKRYQQSAFVSQAYRRQISDLVEKYCRKYGLPGRNERRQMRATPRAQPQEQLALF